MIKTKAKADRAAARQAAAAAAAAQAVSEGTHSTSEPAPSAPAAISAPSAPADENQPSEAMVVDVQAVQEAEEALPQIQREPTITDRTDLLRSKPEVVGRFLRLLVPILVDVYAASVITPVRIKTLTGLLKAVSFLDGDELKTVFTVRRFVSDRGSTR